MRQLIKGNCYSILDKCSNHFDGIITDIPFKGAIKNKLNEEIFSFDKFLSFAKRVIKNNGFLISFCNLKCLIDLVNFGKKYGFIDKTYQIWNKEPLRT